MAKSDILYFKWRDRKSCLLGSRYGKRTSFEGNLKKTNPFSENARHNRVIGQFNATERFMEFIFIKKSAHYKGYLVNYLQAKTGGIELEFNNLLVFIPLKGCCGLNCKGSAKNLHENHYK